MRKELTGRVRIADVARAAGVSKTAVSFALNSPERISAETARRIRSVAADLGYRPDPVARMLTSGATSTIGILSPQPLGEVFSNPFFATFVEGVAATAENHGLSLLLISPLHGSLSKAVGRATVDGMVVLGISGRDATVEALHRAGVPVVIVDAPAAANQPAVEADDEEGACLAARHLAALGHRELLVLSVEPPSTGGDVTEAPVAVRRMRGYRAGLAAFDVSLRPEQVIVAAATIEDGERATLDAWQAGSRPTAILAMSDAAAAGALQAAGQLSLRVPQDLSIVGFDDLPLARLTAPPLTTVHQPIRRKGEEAARLLVEALASRPPSGPRSGLDASPGPSAPRRVLTTSLIVRGSTGPVRIE